MAAPAVVTNIAAISAAGVSGDPITTAAIGASSGTAPLGLVLMLSVLIGTNINFTPEITDSAGNVYSLLGWDTLLSGGAAGAGLWYSNDAHQIVSGSTTFTLRQRTSSAFSALTMRVLELDSPVMPSQGVQAGTNASSTAPAITSGTPNPASDLLWLGRHAAAQNSTGLDTISSSGYTLTPATTAMEGGTTIAGKGGYKQVTGTVATETFNGTITSSPWAAVIAAVEKDTRPRFKTVRRSHAK